MDNENNDDEEKLISRGLYRIVSDIIGPEVLVKLRRERWKISDLMMNSQGNNYISVMSGSMAEGFLFKTSDFDYMFWSTDTVVVNDYSQFVDLHPYFNTALMMECDYTSPGFALVKCITRDDADRSISTTCVWKCSEHWVSSKLFMEYRLSRTPSTTAHGPCQSGEIYGVEYDNAWCLKCAFWPIQATSAITRMRRCGWPQEDVIQEIISDGCLLVPVASKKPRFEGASDLEWRISFSLAEKRLLHSMNHSQFLCYGLWKLFLSEVIKKLEGMEDVLCSYFLKTVVFWEISRDPYAWAPSNYIQKFVRSLTLLTSCVNIGNCPNFFIPENNMFYGKVCGEKQKTLMSHLREFQNEGFLCLLRCPSLQNEFLPIIQRPFLVFNIAIDEGEYISQYALRVMRLQYICRSGIPVHNTSLSLHELSKLQRVNISNDFMSTALTMRTRRLLQNIAERTLHEMMQNNSLWNTNKVRDRYMKFTFNILRDNNTYQGYSELILAKAFYLSADYRRAIHAANIVKTKLQNQTCVYLWRMNDDRCYMLQNDDITIEQFIEEFVATRFDIYEDTSLYELYPEINAARESTGATLLPIPPLVLANFLVILSHHKMNDMIHMYDVLRELHALVHHDNNFHIIVTEKALSWEILGICQQLCGEHLAAYDSYINALSDRYNDFKSATIARINSLQLQ